MQNTYTVKNTNSIAHQNVGRAGISMPAVHVVQNQKNVTQKQPNKEEEPLQMKTGAVQLRGMEEEQLQMKPFQLKSDIVQRQIPGDEEEVAQMKPFQLKSDLIQKQAPGGEEEHLQGKFMPVQRKANTTGLPDNLKSRVENLSGIDISDVKVHYNSDKPAQLQALAYAQGTDIYVGPGQEKHLSHEAWHVVQQKQGRVQPTMQMKEGVTVNDDKGLEAEADVMGAQALSESLNQRHIVLQKTKRSIGTVLQRTIWTYDGEQWMPEGTEDSGSKKLMIDFPKEPQRGDQFNDLERHEPIFHSLAISDGKREEIVPAEEKKRQEEIAPPEAEAATGSRKKMITATDQIPNVSMDSPPVDALELSRDELKAWLAAHDVFYAIKNTTKPYIDRRNKLSSEYEYVTLLLKAPFLLKTRNEDEIMSAKTLVGDELAKLKNNNWLKLSDQQFDEFIEHVKRIIDDPVLMNQGGYPLCGPDVLLRSIVIHKPMEYARYMISLVKGEQGKIGNKTVNLTDPVKAKRYNQKKSDLIPNLLPMSALRSASNRWAYNKIRSDGDKNFMARWHAGISGSTTLGKMEIWVKEMGIKDSEIKKGSYTFSGSSNASILLVVNGFLQSGHAVMLMINPAIMDNKENTPVSKAILYRHWVTLVGEFEKNGEDWTATISTWGELKTMRFQAAQISRSILGYLAVNLKSLPDSTKPDMALLD
jgi:hypothetical protein